MVKGSNFPQHMIRCIKCFKRAKSCVCIKQHPLLQGAFDKVLRVLLKPLHDDGYLESELHVSNDRTCEMLYGSHETGVHIPGGKATHHVIVWGSTPEERRKRIQAKNPKLKASMTSELGAVTPVIVTPVEYSQKKFNGYLPSGSTRCKLECTPSSHYERFVGPTRRLFCRPSKALD